LRFLLTAFIAGESLLLFLPQLPSWNFWAWLLVITSLLLTLIFFLKIKKKKLYQSYFLQRYTELILWSLVFASLGFAWSAHLTHIRLESSLPKHLEGADLLITGVIDGLPSNSPQGLRLSIAVEQVIQEDGQDIDLEKFPKRLALGWYPGWRGDVELPEIQPGQRWKLPVRLKKPHGLMNPHGFDFERWMFQQNLGANGSIRASAKGLPREWKPELLNDFVAGFTSYVELTRWHLRERIKSAAPDGARYVGVLIALVMGEQNAIAQKDWRVFNATGIGHLIMI
jgi:competence protein ComEC